MRNDVGVFDRLDDAFHLQVVKMADAAGGVNAHAHVLHAAAARAGHAHAQGVVAFDVFNDFQPAVSHDVNGRITEGQLLIADPERHALRLLLCQRGYALAAQQGVFACVPSLVAVGVDEGDDVKTARVVIAVVGDGGCKSAAGAEGVVIHCQRRAVGAADHQVRQGRVVAALELDGVQRLRGHALVGKRQ